MCRRVSFALPPRYIFDQVGDGGGDGSWAAASELRGQRDGNVGSVAAGGSGQRDGGGAAAVEERTGQRDDVRLVEMQATLLQAPAM